MTKQRKCLAVVRVRGVGDASPEIEKTLKILHLNRNCHITLLDDRPSYIGMLRKTSHFITWGETSEECVLLLLKQKGRLVGNKKLDDAYAQRVGYKSLADLAEATYSLKTEFKQLPDIKPVFRGHPPKKGYKGKIKKSYTSHGVTGYRGEAINSLVERMI
ncbi:MAG: 50S ribosomal protein L30 [Candidatus Bathyarchaeota archaeon]|nr:50S ribosomal protein L30 [Candidatus Bathyarchaeota archaeon]